MQVKHDLAPGRLGELRYRHAVGIEGLFGRDRDALRGVDDGHEQCWRGIENIARRLFRG